ncbi:superoxide dismutase [Sphingomonas koreensis]|uniref:superoxide dismutase n=1 Tax=Sphingomonas koreensis TaxID=93064 RepID=UPI00082B2DEB|nr:superoxide dismutase [Sphingomonas koreensis]PJI90802.1 Fe-Mn family superoxide dismutase [Sphingomonas koreensis]RSU60223.1 superoxide dismutase [Sphingomonas koreensis]RSU65058.1 superoxide dismutase [Sphingomonas koreensis]
MAFELPTLPYAKDALAPTISAETLDFHYGKHHKAYVDKTNGFVADKGLEGKKLSEVIKHAKETGDKALFNNAAQIWNHSFYWFGLTPEPKEPTDKLAELIEKTFGSKEELVKKLIAEATNHFSNGWGWLVLDGDEIKVTSLHDADTPVVYDYKPLLTIDVWEHAYYIDYRNARPGYLEAITKIIDWDFVAANLDGEGVSRADQNG